MPIVNLGLTGQDALSTIAENETVLDIGGAANVLPRANWVMDILPYEARRAKSGERFDKDHWLQRDICDKIPFPFADKEIDFVCCGETLEDVRDPIWGCLEMVRIGKRGFISTPHRDIESCTGVSGEYCVGFHHHRWFVEVENGKLIFTHKNPLAFSERFRRNRFRIRHLSFLWEDGFEFEERILISEHDIMQDLERYSKWRESQPKQWHFGVLHPVQDGIEWDPREK